MNMLFLRKFSRMILCLLLLNGILRGEARLCTYDPIGFFVFLFF